MGNAPYKCYDEIIGQADVWQQAADEVSRKAEQIKQFFHRHQPSDVLFVGCGSPFYMGESITRYWQRALGIRCGVIPASELMLYPDSYLPAEGSPVMVVVSRSGATTESIWAGETFQKRYPGRTLLVSCAPDSPLDQMANLSILIPDGYEKTVPQTRSFAAMYLATQFMGALLASDDETVATLRNAPAHAARIIDECEDITKEIAEQDIHHAFYMGSGPLYGVAREGSLKMTEMSITTCSAYQFMEARHGPRSIIDEHTLLTGLFGHTARDYETAVMADFVGSSNPVSVALTPNAEWATGNARYHIPVQATWSDAIQGLAYLPVMHLMAYHRAVAKGVNPDESRHLSIFVELG